MEVLSFDLKLSEIIPFDGNSFKVDSVYLWVWHADKIPPHIGISSEGKYFSLKSSGKDEDLNLDKVMAIVKKKKIKTLLFELDSNLLSNEIFQQFDSYSVTKTNEITCLNPIKDLLNYQDARMLKDLLAELKADNRILKTIGLNVDSTFKGIQDYKMEDIHNRLRKLEND